jgi:hypothetical protein
MAPALRLTVILAWCMRSRLRQGPNLQASTGRSGLRNRKFYIFADVAAINTTS